MSDVSVILLFGSNHSDAAALVARAVEIVSLSVGRVEHLSAEYRSEPYGFHAEREFVNRAAEIRTSLDAYEVLRRINLIEALLGRDRDEERRIQQATGEQYASRPIDIDIIFYGDRTFNDERLVIPYHHLYERPYALAPVAEIAAERRHPTLDMTPAEAMRRSEK